MLRYIHVQATPLINDIASWMLQCENYHILPNQYVMDILTALEQNFDKIFYGCEATYLLY